MAVRCKNCTHFRVAPYEARIAGCYLQKNMKSKQDDAFLDEQQQPGDHREINRRRNCPDYTARAKKPGLLSWLLSESA